MSAVRFGVMHSPIGDLLLTGDGDALLGVWFEPFDAVANAADCRRDDAAFAEVKRQLGAYFAGELTDFDLPLEPRGTAFQQRVWDALRTIPYGTTTTYGRLAAMLGEPQASRAVGLANARNPLPIVIPCHRVVGADGSLTGYGGGVQRKQWLLALEGLALPVA